MSNPIAVVAEAQADFDVAAKLIDETLLRTVNWISETDIEHHRAYVGRQDNEAFVRWQSIEVGRGSDYRRAVHRTFGEPLPRHVVQLRIQRAIYEFTIRSSENGGPIPFIVVVKDTDAQDDVREALQESRVQYRESAIVIAM